MDDELAQKLKYLRLVSLLVNWDRYLALAQKGNYSHARLLQYIVDEEYKIKKENSRKMRLNRAKIPEKWVIETFPFDRQPKLNKKKTLGMYDAFDYMTKCRNIIFIGPTGVGKTGLAARENEPFDKISAINSKNRINKGLRVLLGCFIPMKLFFPQRPPGKRVFEIEIPHVLFMTNVNFQTNLFNEFAKLRSLLDIY